MAEPISAVLHRAAELTANGRGRKAVALLRPVAVRHPRSQEVWCRLAAAHLDRGDPGAALVAVKRALPLGGDPAWAHRLASRALSGLDRHDEAVSAARESMRYAPSDWRCRLALAEAFGAAQRWPDAVDAARRAVDMGPTHVRPYLVLGDAAERTRDWSTAERAYRTALRHNPDDPRVRAELSRLRQIRSGRAPAADPAPVDRQEPELLCWRAIRHLSMTVVIMGMLLMVAGLPRPAPLLAWFGLALPAVVVLMALGVLVRAPSGSRLVMLTMPRHAPVVALACVLLAVSVGLILLWAFMVRAGVGSVEPLALAWFCAAGAGGVSFAKTA